MLNILNQPEELLRGLVLSRTPDLFTRKKDGQLLVMNPETGKYAIFSPPYISFFKKLTRPVSYRDFIKNDQGIPPALYVAFIEQAFDKGLVQLSGKTTFSRTKKQSTPDRPTVINLKFTGTGKSFDYFKETLKRQLSRMNSSQAIINFSGKDQPDWSELLTFIRWCNCQAEDFEKKIFYSVSLNSSVDAEPIPEELGSLSTSLDFYIRDSDLDEDPDRLKQLLKTASVCIEKSIPPTLTVRFKEPDRIPGTIEKIVESGVPNVGIKIDPEVLLEDVPISTHIKRMEKFSMGTLEAVDRVFERIQWSRTSVVLSDVQRFVSAIAGKVYPYPCGRRPCGMGTSMFVYDDRGQVFACEPAGQISWKKLLIEDIPEEKNSAVNENKILRDVQELPPRCSRCQWRSFCAGGCPVLALEKYSDPKREDPRCRFFQIIFEQLIWKIHENPILARKIGGLV